MLVSIQFLYMLYILVLRPNESFKENLINIINEVFYSYFIGFLIYYNEEERWNDSLAEIYFWIMMTNNFTIIFITLSRNCLTITIVSILTIIIKVIIKICKRNNIIPVNKTSSRENQTITQEGINTNTRESQSMLIEEHKENLTRNIYNIQDLNGGKAFRTNVNEGINDLVITEIPPESNSNDFINVK